MATATYGAAITSAGAASGDVGDAASHVAVWDDASRTNLVGSFALDSTLAGLAEGQTIQFAADGLVFTLTEGSGSADDISAFGLVEALRGMFRANRYLSWHTGAPGANGTSNRITGIAGTLVTVSNMTYAQ